eukprot:CAMPEP_0201595252 /NCGR_PEP_ID=MMETSP0190_2-20130828/192315_1 /ASSEMBLY_ACC=CAM_ASM_000263 /TAXON_ID=37353 /ORGANISM="Rosalina sp." /LENGTH=145 /DNA_ID=CAMNT_0048055169 /DNA_START=658 /DNA_END=1096 /DNA_ORIENTATION=-
MKPRDSISYVNPNDLATSSKFDLDDPIQKSLLVNADPSSIIQASHRESQSQQNGHTIHSSPATHTHNRDLTPSNTDDEGSDGDDLTRSMTTTHTEDESESESSEHDDRKPRSRRGSLSASGTVSRESSVISGAAEDNVDYKNIMV